MRLLMGPGNLVRCRLSNANNQVHRLSSVFGGTLQLVDATHPGDRCWSLGRQRKRGQPLESRSPLLTEKMRSQDSRHISLAFKTSGRPCGQFVFFDLASSFGEKKSRCCTKRCATPSAVCNLVT